MEANEALNEILPTTDELRTGLYNAVERAMEEFYRDARDLSAYAEYEECYDELRDAISEWERDLSVRLFDAIREVIL